MNQLPLDGPIFYIDRSEPSDMIRYVVPVVDTAEVMGLNDSLYADVLMRGAEGLIQYERKTWRDIVMGCDDVEDQLRREYFAHPEARLGLIIEGVAEPYPSGMMLYSRGMKAVYTGRQEGKQHGTAKKLYAWLHNVQKYMEVILSPNLFATASILCAIYENEQEFEDDHTTFKRHLKKRMEWNPNHHVMRLLGLALNDTNIGTEKAEAIISEFGTVWNVAKAEPLDLAQIKGISYEGAELFLRRIGRPDV